MTTPVLNYGKALVVPGQASANGVNTGAQKTTAPKAEIGKMLTSAKALVPGQGQRDGMGNTINAKAEVLASKIGLRDKLTEQIKTLDSDLSNDKLSPKQKTALLERRRGVMELLAKVESEIRTIEKEKSATEKNVGMDERIAKGGLNIET